MMPSIYDYRHIELDRVGSGKKRLVTPASTSESSDIFGRKIPSSPSGSIFSTSPTPLSRSSSRRSSFRSNDDTKARLFGPPENTLVRRVNNHFRSSILSTESLNSPSPTPSKRRLGPVRRNPITGEIIQSSASPSVYGSDGLPSPDSASSVNGHSGNRNKINGNNFASSSTLYKGLYDTYSEMGSELGSNASLSVNSTPINVRVRQPPGGHCSTAWSTV